MSSTLTPENVCELDTFSLEERIDELQSHPQKHLFNQIIHLAKLQLIDRLEIQQFGRQLANDQYKLDLDYNLPSFMLSKPTLPKKQSQKVRKQQATRFQNNMVAVGSFITIGKPPVNHHYQPKIKQAPQNKPKTFLKSKKVNFSKPKVSLRKQKDEEKQMPVVRVALKEEEKVGSEAKEEVEQFSLKEKLKKEVGKMEVVYRENDIYQDMTVVMGVHNLREEETKIIEQQHLEEARLQSTAEPEAEQIQVDIAIISDKLLVEAQEKHSHQNISKVTVCIQEDCCLTEQKAQLNSQYQKQQRNCPQLSASLLLTESHRLKSNQLTQQTPQLPHRYHPFVTQKEQTTKEFKSRSMKNLNKKMLPTDTDCQILTAKLRQSVTQHHDSIQTHKLHKKHTVDSTKFRSSVHGILKPLPPLKSTTLFPYNEIIHSFTRLFPHSKNILLTLRNVEENLCLHIDKDISMRSFRDEARRLSRQQELTFRMISESQKAKKHSDLFNIDLESFYNRGKIMLERSRNQEEPQPEEMLFYRVVRTKEEVYDIVNSSFHRTPNWYELPHGLELKTSWNLLWTWSKPQIDFSDLFYFQKVNHFIGNKQIARKDLLKKNIEKIQKLGHKIRQFFDIIPQTFLLPGENIPFIKKFRQNGLKDSLNYWILKPVGLSRGRGISLINRLEDVVFSEPVILQKYIMNPLLIDKFKFDMRIYVLVTSINPLQAFIYHQGFARMSTEQYSLSQEQMENKYVHLTNFSIQRENKVGKKTNLQEQLGGSKISLRMLQSRMREMGIEWSNVERQIEDIVLKSLVACMNEIPQNSNCFELFGYDIFIDDNLKCWLLEVNSSPSLEKEFPIDQIIKQQLVDDIVQIVNPLNYDRKRLLQVVRRRRKEAEGLKSSITTSSHSASQLNEDLDYILRGQKLRRYGEGSEHRNFRMIAPSASYNRIIKVLQQYKIDPIVKETSK